MKCKHKRIVKIIDKQNTIVIWAFVWEKYHREYYECLDCGKIFIN
jgi:hypothetical protein